MTRILIFLGLLLTSPRILLAHWENQTIVSGGYERQFRIYTPVDYSSLDSFSLVIGIHGLGSNMYDFSNAMSDFQRIADTARIIMVYPQGTDNIILGNAWNAAAGNLGIYPSEQYDDVHFINDIADFMQANYPIIKRFTYLFGFSNGGFMVHRIACEDNGRFHAFASYAGTIGNKVWNCNPERKVPIIHFHGTKDFNVGYNINLFGKNVDETLEIWSGNNECQGRDVFNVPNTKVDGYFIEHYIYKNCIEPLEFFKVNGAAHVILQKEINDISYAEETWKFFLQARTVNQVVSTGLKNRPLTSLKVYPNPTSDYINITLPGSLNHDSGLEISIWDYAGKQITQMITNSSVESSFRYHTGQLPNGLYLIKVTDRDQVYGTTFCVSN